MKVLKRCCQNACMCARCAQLLPRTQWCAQTRWGPRVLLLFLSACTLASSCGRHGHICWLRVCAFAIASASLCRARHASGAGSSRCLSFLQPRVGRSECKLVVWCSWLSHLFDDASPDALFEVEKVSGSIPGTISDKREHGFFFLWPDRRSIP